MSRVITESDPEAFQDDRMMSVKKIKLNYPYNEHRARFMELYSARHWGMEHVFLWDCATEKISDDRYDNVVDLIRSIKNLFPKEDWIYRRDIGFFQQKLYSVASFNNLFDSTKP
jgi:hypothetical protein